MSLLRGYDHILHSMATIAAEASESDQGGRSKRSTDDGGVPVFIGRSVLQRGGGSSDIVDSNNSVINIPPSSTILSCIYTVPVGMTGLFTELKMVTTREIITPQPRYLGRHIEDLLRHIEVLCSVSTHKDENKYQRISNILRIQ